MSTEEKKTWRNAEDAECALCWEIMEKPLMLPCKHSFCSKCMNKLVATGVLQLPMVRICIRIEYEMKWNEMKWNELNWIELNWKVKKNKNKMK